MGAFEFVVSDGAQAGQAFAFPSDRFVVGSSADCELRFDPSLVQPRHAEVTVTTDGVFVKDLTAHQLVWLNGVPSSGGTLSSGGFLRLGRLELVLRQRGQSSPSGTLATPTPWRSERPADPTLGLDVTAKRPTPFASAPVSVSPQPKRATPQRISSGGPAPAPASGVISLGAPLASGDAPLSELAPGYVIDNRYRIVSKIASGGMGEVYKAEHVELGKPFAIKVMLPELSRDAEFVARFKREAISASRIGQQNIVDISDFGQTGHGRFYFVMEYLDGLTLASVTHREGALRVERVLNIALQIARALAAAHAQNIVHRDLKPENIMLLQRPGQPDFAKVLDFGVAKVPPGQGQAGHTAIGMVVGTPQYMSPEQAKAVAVDARSDIYSLGLIFYELITGRPTFSAETPSMLMVKHVTEAPPPFEPGPLGDVPVELKNLVFAMLEKEPAARPQTMTSVVATLDDVWRRTKANDPTLRRISGEFPLAGGKAPPRRGPDGAPPASRVSGKRPAAKEQPEVAPEPVAEVADPQSAPEATGVDPTAVDGSGEFRVVKKSPLPFVVIGLVLVGLGVGGFMLWRGDAPPPPADAPVVAQADVGQKPSAPVPEAPPAPPASTTPIEAPPPPNDPPPAPTPGPANVPDVVELRFESKSGELEVVDADSRVVGHTPFALSRPLNSTATLTFRRAGYQPLTRTFAFVTSQTRPIELLKGKVTSPKKKTSPKPDDDLKEFQ